jgi:hypothetical protein
MGIRGAIAENLRNGAKCEAQQPVARFLLY